MKYNLVLFAASGIMMACGSANPPVTYYEVGFKNATGVWQDTSFVVATSDPALIAKADGQLKLPVNKRQLVTGALLAGNGGFNKNATHEFKWHFPENEWDLADIAMELCDGRPYSDVDKDPDYWINTVKRFCPWSSYIKRKL